MILNIKCFELYVYMLKKNSEEQNAVTSFTITFFSESTDFTVFVKLFFTFSSKALSIFMFHSIYVSVHITPPSLTQIHWRCVVAYSCGRGAEDGKTRGRDGGRGREGGVMQIRNAVQTSSNSRFPALPYIPYLFSSRLYIIPIHYFFLHIFCHLKK